MSAIRALLSRLSGFLHRERRDRELDEELASHLQMQIEDNLRCGMTPEQARREALLKSGGLELAKEECRDRRGLPMLETVLRDLRHAARILRRSPAFTAVAVLLLALGIGANTAIFTLLDQVMLRVLPVKNPQQLVMIWTTGPNLGGNQGSRAASYPMYQDFQQRAEAFSYVFCRYYTAALRQLGERIGAGHGRTGLRELLPGPGGRAGARTCVLAGRGRPGVQGASRRRSEPPILGEPLWGGPRRGREEDPGQQLPYGHCGRVGGGILRTRPSAFSANPRSHPDEAAHDAWIRPIGQPAQPVDPDLRALETRLHDGVGAGVAPAAVE